MTADYTAENWPIAAAMLPFGSVDSHGGPIHDAEPEEWAKHLNLVARLGFTEVDPTDTWVRVADLGPKRLADFQGVLKEAGLTIPAISTSRRSVMDPEHGEEYLEYSHRLLDAAAEIGVPMVSFGFFQAFTPAQQKALWFWLEDGWHDDESPSMFVYEDGVKCYVCGKYLDAIGWVMETEGLSFPAAVRRLTKGGW